MSDYRVVAAHSIEALEERVRALLTEGWVVQGGVAHAMGGFYQAMTRPAPDAPA